jgi:hypothetical protein
MSTPKRTPRYAATTTVKPEDSRREIEAMLKRYGAESVGYVEEKTFAAVYFRLKGQAYRLDVRMPQLDDLEVRFTPTGQRRYDLAAKEKAQAQLYRSRWRSLLLWIHATLDAITAGVTTPERALFAYLLLPSGRSMYDATRDDLAAVDENGLAPKLLEPPR